MEQMEGPAYSWADHIRGLAWPGVDDVVPSYDTVGVYVDPERFDARLLASLDSAALAVADPPTRHRIPVCYEMGEDLLEASLALGLEVEEFIAEHLLPTYPCAAIGFCPGFPYLRGLGERISGLPRRPDPRTHVPAGSVAITGSQTGIYPLDVPGGWWLIGMTPLTIVAPEDGYFPIRAGDDVVFERIDEADYTRLKGQRL